MQDETISQVVTNMTITYMLLMIQEGPEWPICNYSTPKFHFREVNQELVHHN